MEKAQCRKPSSHFNVTILLLLPLHIYIFSLNNNRNSMLAMAFSTSAHNFSMEGHILKTKMTSCYFGISKEIALCLLFLLLCLYYELRQTYCEIKYIFLRRTWMKIKLLCWIIFSPAIKQVWGSLLQQK